jgi:hypothetical protein
VEQKIEKNEPGQQISASLDLRRRAFSVTVYSQPTHRQATLMLVKSICKTPLFRMTREYRKAIEMTRDNIG